jgi:hypothetical protein
MELWYDLTRFVGLTCFGICTLIDRQEWRSQQGQLQAEEVLAPLNSLHWVRQISNNSQLVAFQNSLQDDCRALVESFRHT